MSQFDILEVSTDDVISDLNSFGSVADLDFINQAYDQIGETYPVTAKAHKGSPVGTYESTLEELTEDIHSLLGYSEVVERFGFIY